MIIIRTEEQYKKALLKEFGETIRDPKEWYLSVLEWVDSPEELDFETDDVEVVVYNKNGYYLGYYDKEQSLGFVVNELEDDDEENIAEDDGAESSSGGSTTKWEDIVSLARGPSNTLDNSPWAVEPNRGSANTIDNSPWSDGVTRGPDNQLS